MTSLELRGHERACHGAHQGAANAKQQLQVQVWHPNQTAVCSVPPRPAAQAQGGVLAQKASASAHVLVELGTHREQRPRRIGLSSVPRNRPFSFKNSTTVVRACSKEGTVGCSQGAAIRQAAAVGQLGLPAGINHCGAGLWGGEVGGLAA